MGGNDPVSAERGDIEAVVEELAIDDEGSRPARAEWLRDPAVGQRPAEVCGCSSKPASPSDAITLRIVAALSPCRLICASVRDPTGSPVVMYVSTIAVRISRSRAAMGVLAGIRKSGSQPLLSG